MKATTAAFNIFFDIVVRFFLSACRKRRVFDSSCTVTQSHPTAAESNSAVASMDTLLCALLPTCT